MAQIDALDAQPSVQARMLGVVGRMQHGMGEYDDAGRLLARAVAIHRTVDDPVALAESLIHLSWVHRSRRELDDARRLVAEALDIRRRTLPADHEDIADAVYELGFVAPTSQELEARYREALDMLERTGARPDWQLRLRQGLATSLRRQGQLAEALAMDREALALAIREFGPAHRQTANAMIHLADQVRDIEQDLAAAERLYLDGMSLIRRQSGEHHLDLIHPLHALAVLETRRGRYVESETYRREALRIRAGALGERHPVVALSLTLLALDLARQGRVDQAEATARDAVRLLEEVLGPRHPDVGTGVARLAQVLVVAGRPGEADEAYRAAIDLKPPRSEGLAIDVAEIRREYGRVLIDQRRYPDAEVQLLESLRLLEGVYGASSHPNIDETRRALMRLYAAARQPEMVERYRVPDGEYFPY